MGDTCRTTSSRLPSHRSSDRRPDSRAAGRLWARKRIVIPAALLIFFVGVGIGSSGNSDQEKSGAYSQAEPQPTVTVTKTAAARTTKDDDGKQTSDNKAVTDEDKKATVPNFVGMGLQSAQDKAQEVGFYGLTSHDALGRDRMQAFDRNWKVCSQNVKAGASKSTETKLDFGAVKLEEVCPAKDEKPLAVEGGKMPDFMRQVGEGGSYRARLRYVHHRAGRPSGRSLGAGRVELEGMRADPVRGRVAERTACRVHRRQVRRDLSVGMVKRPRVCRRSGDAGE